MKTPEQIFDEAIQSKGLDIVSVKDADLYEAGLYAIKKALSIAHVVGQSEQLSCGRNITTCVFYKEGGKCSNLEYCRDQTT